MILLVNEITSLENLKSPKNMMRVSGANFKIFHQDGFVFREKIRKNVCCNSLFLEWTFIQVICYRKINKLLKPNTPWMKN